jgi:hypothetical protein
MGENVEWDEVAGLVADRHRLMAPRRVACGDPDTGSS